MIPYLWAEGRKGGKLETWFGSPGWSRWARLLWPRVCLPGSQSTGQPGQRRNFVYHFRVRTRTEIAQAGLELVAQNWTSPNLVSRSLTHKTRDDMPVVAVSSKLNAEFLYIPTVAQNISP
ncbi:hypothetical protein RRG08_051658 [Elysia crispata]|uniref:Uncharacterized protein n=1 Tax=Elysia crispata TaxID=231223 RepID=A0AAE1DS08_9GAST|nr:hypothetical protein RRG08_051658 [Elysia crispata]